MKKVLTLETATRIKGNLESKNGTNSIDKDNLLIEDKNSVITGEEREIDINEIEKRKEIKTDLIMVLHEPIMEVNMKKLKGDKHTNTFYIKKLSQLDREKFHLNEITKVDTKKKDKLNEQSLKLIPFIKLKDILKRIERIDKDIQEIKGKISKFNKENSISIEITKEMEDLIKTMEN